MTGSQEQIFEERIKSDKNPEQKRIFVALLIFQDNFALMWLKCADDYESL